MRVGMRTLMALRDFPDADAAIKTWLSLVPYKSNTVNIEAWTLPNKTIEAGLTMTAKFRAREPW